jgi:NADPH-dependent glutamate synthase beta subunit-like oxidoreductase
LPPCNEACPAGEDIQGWLALAVAGDLEGAWRHLVRDNPLPAVVGRVCYHPCETKCNRAQLDSAVSIHAVERFLGDRARELGWKVAPDAPASGKRVLVVGAGPSGLSAAHHLACLGHTVEVRDAGPVAGGMMVFGIPAYRLPRPVLAEEVQRIAELGVRFVFDHKVEDLLAEKREGGFDAVFLAIGAHIGKRTEIPARDAGKILDALSFLRGASEGSPPKLGRRVAIYGGGNTAMDAARTARRLGYEPLIIYRRDREHMPATKEEADEAVSEGVKIHWLRTIKTIDATSFTVEVMELDAAGKPRPTGELETIEADSLVLALGQDVDTSFLERVDGLQRKRDGTIVVSRDLMTGHEGIFAGGDMVPSERTVTVAIGHGKKAARSIDAYLRGTPVQRAPKHPVAGFGLLHLPFYTDAAQRPQPHLDEARRVSSFEEVVSGLDEKAATYEARRCLSCGNCYECDGCYAACPEDAIVKLGPGKRYRYDYDRCTGCAVCFEQCPCHAIEMIPERP